MRRPAPTTTKCDAGDGCGTVIYRVRGVDRALRMDDAVMLVNTPEWMSAEEAARTADVLREAVRDMRPKAARSAPK